MNFRVHMTTTRPAQNVERTTFDSVQRVHAAVVHGLPHELPEPLIPVVRWHLARWQVGLAVPSRLSGHSFEAVLRSGVPIAQREPAAASQQAFERARVAAGIAALPPGPYATGHIDAARTAATLDGAAVTTEGAAQTFDLPFLALEQHVAEVWVAEPWVEQPGVNALGELLSNSAFTERVAHFGGYDLTHCGERIDAASASTPRSANQARERRPNPVPIDSERDALSAECCCLLERPQPEEQEMKLSARNQLAGTVVSINKGEAIANVELNVAGQRLVASITVEAVEELGLEPGKEIVAVIKASDVMIGVS